MAVTFVGGGRGAVAMSSEVTFTTLWGGFSFGSAGTLTEVNVARPVRVAGTFSNLTYSVNNTGTSRSLTFRVSSANGNEVVSPTDSTSGVFSTSLKDHVGVGQNFDLLVAGSSQVFDSYYTSAKFLADAGTAGYAGGSLTLTALTTAAIGTQTFNTGMITGSSATVATFRPDQTLFRTTPTISNFCINVYGFSVAGAFTANTWKNNVLGNCSIAVASNATGSFEDVTHSDTVASGDLYNFAFTPASGHTPTPVIQPSATLTYPSAASELFSNSGTLGAAATNFNQIMTSGNTSAAMTEAAAQMAFTGEDGSLSNMRFWIGTNTVTAASSFVLRKDGADTAMAIVVGSGATGAFEDATHTVTFKSSNLFCYRYAIGATGTSLIQFANTLTITPIDYIRGYPVYADPIQPKKVETYGPMIGGSSAFVSS
jgi:hypothetical protein